MSLKRSPPRFSTPRASETAEEPFGKTPCRRRRRSLRGRESRSAPLSQRRSNATLGGLLRAPEQWPITLHHSEDVRRTYAEEQHTVDRLQWTHHSPVVI